MFFFASCSEGGDKTRSSSRPSQYPLLGFKDRKLEDDYLEHLVVASRARIILANVTAILLYGSGLFAFMCVDYDLAMWVEHLYSILSDEQKEDFKESRPEGRWSKYFPNSWSTLYAFDCLVLVMFILGGFVAYLHLTR